MRIDKKQINEYNALLEELGLEAGLKKIITEFDGKIKFSTSFGIEDQVLTHFLNPFASKVGFFTLDTGRQFNETYEVFQKTQDKYQNINFEVYYPAQDNIQDYVSTDGINGFYNSIESRKKCCGIRKIIPLKKALKDVDLWITGLRAEQSPNRETMQFLEWDEENQLIKFNPLLKVTLSELEAIVEAHNIPINSLYKKGFLSIGCQPCTRALMPGEDFRAGRWWWENGKKECGLHLHESKNN